MNIEITVDTEVFHLLKSKAEPFVDTPNSVLRRLLGLDAVDERSAPAAAPALTPVRRVVRQDRRGSAKHEKRRTRAPSGTLLPEERYELPLLRALVQADGRGASKEIIEAVGRELKDDLTPLDLETLSSGGVRWQSRIQFVRLRLIERGLMDKNTPRGVWGISARGREFLSEVTGAE